MKKIITIVITLIMCTMILCGCKSKKEADISDNSILPQLSESKSKKTTVSSTKPSTRSVTESSTEPSTEPSTKPSTDLGTKFDETLPEELVGLWVGTGEPKNGGNPIKLEITVNADATGEYTFEQAGYTESYPFTLEKKSSSFTVNIPANNKLGISNCSGTYEYADSKLTLHIKTNFSSGGSYAYTAICTKKDESQADNTAVESGADIDAAVEYIKKD